MQTTIQYTNGQTVIRVSHLASHSSDSNLGWAVYSADGTLIRTGTDWSTKPSANALVAAGEQVRALIDYWGKNQTITVYRYCAARTQKMLLAEIANPRSHDWGTGEEFCGLVVAVAPDQELPPIGPPETEMHAHYTPGALASYLHTQGIATRVMWQFDISSKDIIGLAGRWYGGHNGYQHYLADGVVIRPGTKIINIKKIKI